MAKYIDVDKTLQSLPDDLPYKASVKRVLMQAPEADVVEVKRGSWKRGVPYICSVCGNSAPEETNTSEMYSCWISPYCPNCGAEMDGKEAINNG